jgi:hypothetical protein
MAYVIQALIALAVVAANIHFEFTENNYIVAAWAFMAAYGLTLLWLRIRNALSLRSGRRLKRENHFR